ncbi:PREDICTED: serine/threonine-protein kinase S6KL-like isoform X2 [Nicrophorus vespilloides]|uniref:Serine/threonine-protein kinase S6KL-like isoform X2 n=1 Tax=Nicrophorus vespilloides TaxID=110193 RepID=A0ABM1MUF7_NICVS|nr:PREDICTED: serine/threonine-protein kinase S6KL-like isoform X2 [Nicrophorus vespilloides]
MNSSGMRRIFAADRIDLMHVLQFPGLEAPLEMLDVDARRAVLPTDVDLDHPSRDLLRRLLEMEPTKRLRSLRTLHTIAFYKDFSFEDVRNRKISPNELMRRFYPHGFQRSSSTIQVDGFDADMIET